VQLEKGENRDSGMKMGGITKWLNYRSNMKETGLMVQPCEMNDGKQPKMVMQQEQK
jgi:hypothetical protein